MTMHPDTPTQSASREERARALRVLRQYMDADGGPAGIYRLGSEAGENVVLAAMLAFAGDEATPPASEGAAVEDIFRWVEARSHPSIATAWMCGLAATTLCWMFRLARFNPTIVTDVIEGAGHLWVEMGGNYYDPTIGQFGEYAGSGSLPHPLSSAPKPTPEAAPKPQGEEVERQLSDVEVIAWAHRYADGDDNGSGASIRMWIRALRAALRLAMPTQ